MRKKNTLRRILAALLLYSMLLCQLGVLAVVNASAAESLSLDLSTYTKDLYFYNHLNYTGPTGNLQNVSAETVYTLGGNSAVSVMVGDNALGAAPLDHDISLAFNKLTVGDGKSVTILPVNGGARSVKITVSGASSVASLVVAAGAKATVTLAANLTLSSLTLEKDAELTIQTGTHTVTVDSSAGSGALTVSGNGTLKCEGSLSVGDLTLNSGTVDSTTSGSLKAERTITVNGTTVKNLKLFGFDDGVSGEKTITFNSGTFQNVETVGAKEDSPARVTMKGMNALSSSGTHYVLDYPITYRASGVTLTPEDDWPTYYRVRHDSAVGGNTTVLGLHTGDATFTPADTVELPTLQSSGLLGFVGWTLDGVEIDALPSTQRGDVLLVALLEEGTVTVELNLGYTPQDYTNDESLKAEGATYTAKVGDTVTLPSPERFGHLFVGWRITSGNNPREITDTTYTILQSDLNTAGGSYALHMEACWRESVFSFRLMIPETPDPSRIVVSVDGGSSWTGFSDWCNANTAHFTYDAGNKTLVFNDPIRYGERIDEYFAEIFGNACNGFPMMKDTNADGNLTLASWYNTRSGRTVYATESYSYGNGGFLVKPQQNLTLKEWAGQLQAVPISLTPLWVETSYSYTLKVTDNSGVAASNRWSILVSGKTATPNASGEITVPLGATVTFCQPNKSPISLTHWSINGVETLTERPQSSTDKNKYYDFIMPASDVTAVCRRNNVAKDSDPLLFNLSQSPITFAENVIHNGSARTGFWYGERSSEMTPLFYQQDKGYFYLWNFAEPIYVTTQNTPTQNQLTIVNEISGIYLVNCHMLARDEYLAAAQGRFLGGMLMEKGGSGATSAQINGADWSSYGNIVIDNESNPKYNINLYISGANTIGAILPKRLHTAAAYASPLNLTGLDSSSSLTLGSATCFGFLTVKNLTVNAYSDKYDYLLYTLTEQMQTDNINIVNSIINAPAERLYNSYNYITVSGTSQVKIGSVFVGYYLKIQDSAYVHVTGDVVCCYYSIEMTGASSLLVDGGIYTLNYTAHYGEGKVNTSGYLIVRGLGIVGTGLKVETNNATVIANLISASRGSTFTKGTVITNHLLNPPVYPALNKTTGAYVITPVTSNCTANGDSYPFATHSNTQDTASVFTFNGSHVFLLGYYKNGFGNSSQSYDTSANAKSDTSNPITAIINQLLDANGDLQESLRKTSNHNEIRAAAKTAMEQLIADKTYAANECVQVGNTTHTADSKYGKSVLISGGELWAAGKLTFYNTVTVSGGKVTCGGSFGSKLDVTVKGGTIKASEVGIAYNCTTTENGLTRYSLLKLSGGSVTTDRIGSLSTAILGVSPKGVVDLSFGSTLSPLRTGEAIAVATVLYNNYLFDNKVFKKDASAPVCLDFMGSYRDGTFSIAMSEDIVLTPPTLIAGGDAYWLYDDPNGEKIEFVSKEGLVNGDTVFVYDGRYSLALYAVKTSYTLTVDGDYGSGFTVKLGESLLLSGNGSTTVSTNQILTIAFTDSEMLYRTVVYFKDAAGVIHNLLGADAVSNGTITFKMPYADGQIYITKELTLYLDRYDISFRRDGFALEEKTDARREDSVFVYHGDIRIAQNKNSNNKKLTYNRIFFETADSGNVTTGRKITLDNLQQNTLGQLSGMMICNGADVRLTIAEGTTMIAPVDLPEQAKITFIGATDDRARYQLYFNHSLSIGSHRSVGSSGRTGTVTYQNLYFHAVQGRYFKFAVSPNGYKSSNPVSFINCYYKADAYYTYDVMVQNMGAVLIRDCEFNIRGREDVSSPLVDNCDSLTIENSSIAFSYGGGRGGNSLFIGVNGKITLRDSSIDMGYLRSTGSTYIEKVVSLSGDVVMHGSSSITADHRLILKSLTMNDSSTLSVKVAGGANDGHLFCPTIVLDGEGASLNVGYVVLSGFVTSNLENKAKVEEAMKTGNVLNGASYQGLTVRAGTVNASRFVGGDLNAKITVLGGAVNTPALGTFGAYMGYARYIPNQNETEFVYILERIPQAGTVVTISGGRVSIAEDGYLGGMNCKVVIDGGDVELASGAVLGLTEAQKTLLYNDAASRGVALKDAVTVLINGGNVVGTDAAISTPYGSATVSGSDACVNVKRFAAESGTILISAADGGFVDNPYTGSEKPHAKTSVHVSDTLEALYMTVSDGSVVYAYNAYTTAKQGENGFLLVKSASYLYIGNTYGSFGKGEFEIEKADDSKIYGKIQYVVLYVLCDDARDPAENKSENPTSFIFSDSDIGIPLVPPVRAGYEFIGWFDNASYDGTPINSLTTRIAKDYTLYAKWAPKKATFYITIDLSGFDELEKEVEGYAGSFEGTVFTFAQTLTIEYLAPILGDAALNLENYFLRSLAPSSATIGGKAITPEDLVLREYVEGGKQIEIKLGGIQPILKKITLHLNLNALGLPLGAAFNWVNEPNEYTSTVIRSYVDINKTISNGLGFTTGTGELITPTAPGYLCLGWFDDEGNKIDHTYKVTTNGKAEFYAKWEAQEYYIAFDAGTNAYDNAQANKVTVHTKDTPDGETARILIAKVTYDQPLSSAIWVFSSDGVNYVALTEAQISALPLAWAEGFVCSQKWSFDGVQKSASTHFNLTSFPGVELDLAWAQDTANKQTAVTLSPVLETIKIEYHLGGGATVGEDWKASYGAIDTATKGVFIATTQRIRQALLGYVASDTAQADTAAFTVLQEVAANGKYYSVIGTTAAYYKNGESYVTNDYRHQLLRKGYTFGGWRVMQRQNDGSLTPLKDGENDVFAGSFPLYHDLIVEAVWTANTYTVVLNPYDNTSVYPYTSFNQSAPVEVTLDVSKEITDITLWPNRGDETAWYAYDKNNTSPEDAKKRFLLGFTFDPLDPGSTAGAGYNVYLQYAEDVTKLLNQGQIYSHSAGTTPGSLFGLPADEVYNESIVEGIEEVQDFPNGSTLQMYAVYRERSLVFMEYYKDGDGVINQRTMASFPWDSYSNYPYAQYRNEENLPDANAYKLIKWAINTPTTAGETYTEALYSQEAKRNEFKEAATQLGTYDIIVYTVYAAQAESTGDVLGASTNPTDTAGAVFTYALPGSMQTGQLTYLFEGLNGLTLVSGDALERFDSDIANNTVAIKATLLDPMGAEKESKWLLASGGTLFTASATGGWRVALQLYHSSVMSQDIDYVFDLTLGFSDNGLEDQKIIFKGMKVSLAPSRYTVEYEAKLPTDPKVEDWSGFDEDTRLFTQESVAYGSTLLSTVPQVEGYSANGFWKATETLAYGAPLIADQTAEAAVEGGSATLHFTTEWEICSYQLSFDTTQSRLLGIWTVHANGAPINSPVSLNYRTKLILRQTGGEARDQYPEFVTITVSDGKTTLDLFAQYNGAENGYVMTMPASNLTLGFNRLVTLYLTQGSIAIGVEQFEQNGTPVVWHGDYTVLSNAENSATATANTLTLAGDLSDRSITLGNLKITADHSIALADDAKVNLTVQNGCTVDAKNLAVPSTATLRASNGSMKLTPSAGNAAIGGANGGTDGGKNGMITLENMNLSLLLYPSKASGIGPANKTAGGNAIKLDGCTVEVSNQAQSGQLYEGVWIGGIGVEAVTLNGTKVLKANDSVTMIGPIALHGKSVTLTDSTVGTVSTPITAPIGATNSLVLNASAIYQSLDQGTAIECEGVITVQNQSTVYSAVTTPTALYTGTMKIMDVASSVVIANTQILETKHGNITITDSGHTQDSTQRLHSGSYLLLHTLDGDAAPDLTVSSIAATGSVTLEKVTLGAVTVNTSANFLLNGEVRADRVAIANGCTMTVTADASDRLSLTNGFDSALTGSYVQSGGSLHSDASLALGGNLTLNDVTATATHAIGSLCPTGAVTTVTLNGGSITAETIGALGAQNETFTFVILQNAPAITGTLVQDHFRLAYDSTYDTSALDTVLRTELLNGVGDPTPYPPAHPADTNFLYWYFKGTDGKVYAITSDPTDAATVRVTGILPEHVAHAADGTDGTKTLTVYAWLNLLIEAVIEDGRLYNESDFALATGTSVTIVSTGFWTARFEVNGSAVTDGTYVLRLGSKFPTGTVLTLGVLSATVPEFYYYYCTGNETEIPLSAFRRMGTKNTSPALLQQAAGDSISDVLVITACFASASASALSDVSVTLALTKAGNTVQSANVSYSTKAAVTVSAALSATTTEAEDAQCLVTLANTANAQTENGKALYLILTLSPNDPPLPYGAEAWLTREDTQIIGTRLGESCWAFANAATEDGEWTLSTLGWSGGRYTLSWQLVLGAIDTRNVLGTPLASADSVTLTVTPATVHSMAVVLDTVDGVSADKAVEILSSGVDHIVTFVVTTTLSPDYITVTRESLADEGVQTEYLQPSVNEAGTVFGISFSKDLAAGTYRIRFSMDRNLSSDDVVFNFVIE